MSNPTPPRLAVASRLMSASYLVLVAGCFLYGSMHGAISLSAAIPTGLLGLYHVCLGIRWTSWRMLSMLISALLAVSLISGLAATVSPSIGTSYCVVMITIPAGIVLTVFAVLTAVANIARYEPPKL